MNLARPGSLCAFARNPASQLEEANEELFCKLIISVYFRMLCI